MIYALIDKKQFKKSEDFLFGSLTAMIDEYLDGEIITPKLLKKLTSKDTLVVKNVLALGKNVNEIVLCLQTIAGRKINLCLAQENLSFKAEMLPELSESLLLAFRLHQSLISLRSKTALQERKAQGVKLGRPYGTNPGLKLEDNKEEIKKLLLSGMSKDKIAEKFNVCRSTVYNFVKKNPELLMGE